MKVLFVTPSEVSSGEAMTALHMAESVVGRGVDVHFLASDFTAHFLEKELPGRVTMFTQDAAGNRQVWDGLLRTFGPDVVVFADFPLLFFSSAVARLADEAWVRSLGSLDATLATLDHMGYAQRPMRVFFGPPHLSSRWEDLPGLPGRMHILLPCPMQEPGAVSGRRGVPFRYWNLPIPVVEDKRQALRRRYLRDPGELLILHSVPTWAWKTAQRFGLPYYSFLSEILEHYLDDLARPATVISINNGDLLAPSGRPKIRIFNLAALPMDEFERLVLACDLMITENRVSVSLGKAICGLRPCAVLRNSYRLEELLACVDGAIRTLIVKMEQARLGAVYPYEVFPIWRQEDLEQLGLFNDNSVTEGFASIEVFGGGTTRRQLQGLLMDEATREAMRSRQHAYTQRLKALGGAEEALLRIAGKEFHP